MRRPREVRFADLGTGTGCIGITLALELPHSRGLLLEFSAGALPVAARNIRSLHAADRLALVQGDMFMPPLMPRGLDVLVSNPPYIAAAEEGEVMAEVLRHEPHSALFSGQDGLRHLRAVIRAGRQAPETGRPHRHGTRLPPGRGRAPPAGGSRLPCAPHRAGSGRAGPLHLGPPGLIRREENP